MPRYIIRLADIPFSKDFISTLKSRGVILSRRDVFGRSAICINHGNAKPITIRDNVKKFILINKPEAIKYCSNKRRNCKMLKDFYPTTYSNVNEVDRYPVVVKPLHGFQGVGIEKIESRNELDSYISRHNSNKFLIQECIPMKFEYRFNVLDRDIFQISKKQLIEGWNGKFKFTFRSLGTDAKISNKFFNYVKSVIEEFHSQVGHDLGSYCIDVMKGKDKKYYLSEINSGYGIGQFTLEKLLYLLNEKYDGGELDNYRVK